jgi:hypothetical protein
MCVNFPIVERNKRQRNSSVGKKGENSRVIICDIQNTETNIHSSQEIQF